MAYSNLTGLPSVTSILRIFIDTRWMTEESRERGQAVHAACNAMLNGVYHYRLPGDWQLYVDSFSKWVDHADPKVILTEKRLVSGEGWCGQPDLVCRINGKAGPGLIDIKTAQQCHKWHRLQGAAYRQLCYEDGIKTQWGGNLRLKSDGSMPIYDPWPDDYGCDLERFRCAFVLNQYNGGQT